MFKKISFFLIISLLLFTSTAVSQEDDEGDGVGFVDIYLMIGAILSIGVIILLRYMNLLPDFLYNFLLCISTFGLFYALEGLFEATGFVLSIGGVEIPPLAIGFLFIFLIYHQVIIQLLSLFRQSL